MVLCLKFSKEFLRISLLKLALSIKIIRAVSRMIIRVVRLKQTVIYIYIERERERERILFVCIQYISRMLNYTHT